MSLGKDPFKIAFLTLLLIASSCVKDVDLDQYEEILLTPEAAIDLIFFTITTNNFSSSPGGDETAWDETRLDFLDDDYIQDNLVRADFNFKLRNTFESPLTVTVRFLSPSNSVQHTIIIPVQPGNSSDPATVDYIESIFQNEIGRIKRSIKISVEITKHDPAAVEGDLQMESKGFYYFEFES